VGGFYGIVFAGILFSLTGYIVLNKVYRERIRNFDELVIPMMGWFAGKVMEVAATVFVFCVFCIMLAGAGNIIQEWFGISFRLSVLIMGIISTIAILTSIKGVVSVSTVITPVLIAGIIATGLYIIIFKDTSVFNFKGVIDILTKNWFFSSLLYVGYNSLLSVTLLCSLLPYLKTKRVGTLGGILGGLVLCFVALVLNTAIYLFYPSFISGELPVLGLVGKHNWAMKELYTIILWLAMFTSAVTAGYCSVERIKKKIGIPGWIAAVIICAAAVPLSTIGFSNLIVVIYPAFGYAGLFLIIALIVQEVSNRINRLRGYKG
jgi:uncharacterized membrane protein YkvI